MAGANFVVEDISPVQMATSTSHLPVHGKPEIAEKCGGKQDSSGCKKKEESNAVSFYKLFSFSDSTDYVLMIVGTITAVGSGLAMPLQAVILGELVNTFGENAVPEKVVQVSKVAVKYVYLSLGPEVVCWTVTGERQAARFRSMYLKALSRQDVGFFDQESNTGEFVERMSGDTVVIQDAIEERVGQFIQLVSTFMGGFVIAFVQGWLLALVLLSSIPLLVISAACMTIFIAKLASLSQTA